MPRFVISIPPMPKPEEFGIDWEADAVNILLGDRCETLDPASPNSVTQENIARGKAAKTKMEAYNKALDTWKEVASLLVAATKSNL